MGKPLSRPGCFRKSSCCLEKHGAGDGGVGGRAGGVEGGYGDGYVPQRSIYDTMCINQQIDSHHHHPGGSIRRDCGGEGSFSYSASGSLRVSRPPADMFDPQPRSLTPNPSFVRRLDERAIFDSLKLGGQDADGEGCHSPGCFTRSVSPSVSSFSVPGVSSSSSKKHHHHHHHGDSTKSRDGRHSWKVLTPPKHLECLELTTTEMMDRGSGYLNPGHYPPPGGQSSSLTSPLISPFSGSPLSSGYHTPVFFSPAKPRPSQTQSLRCSPPHVIQPRHYSQTQSLRLSPPHELRRSPYRAPLVQLSAHDLEQDLRDRGGGWGRSDREREWEREREREMERGWAQREWERERERGRLERERARERERRETTFGTFGYGRPVPLRSDRDSVFLEPDQVLDTTPLLLPQPSPSPSPSVAPRMGTGAVGRNRAGSKVGPESVGGGMVPKFDNVSGGLVLVESKSGCGPRSVSEVGAGNMSEVEIRAGIQEHHRAEGWNKYDKASIKNGSETRMGSHVKTRPGGRDLEGKVQSGLELENMAPAVNREGHKGGARSGEKTGRVVPKPESIAEASAVTDTENNFGPGDEVEIGTGSSLEMKPEIEAQVDAKASSRQMENRTGTEAGGVDKFNNEAGSAADNRVEAKVDTEVKIAPTSEPDAVLEAGVTNETGAKSNSPTEVVSESQNSNKTTNKDQLSIMAEDNTDTAPADQVENTLDINRIESSHVEKGFRYQKSKSSKSSSRTRPGTATGLRPGVVSPRLSRGLRDLESTGPPEGIESTWPRRIIVRKRTVRQGGALHNLPILPPLPSVLSALEKRRPHTHLHPHPGHFSENLLTNAMNASIVGRCSLKESSHPEPGGQLVGRASLKEQNLEHWRVCREQEDPMRSRSKEKQGQQTKEKTEREERMGKEEEREKEKREIKDKREEKVGKEKERVTVSEGLVEDTRQDKSERRFEEKVQEDGNKKEDMKKEKDVEIKSEKAGDRGMKIKDGIEERHEQELEEVVAKLKTEESEMEGGDRGTFGEEGGMESWDAVLEMVTTLWDDGWDKGGAGEGGGDTDSFSGSLQRWPLLRPPIGFGGSHPPSSAASELSLTELERRARELDYDLEHLDLSQPHRDTQDLYQTLLEPQRERADMYQTHPGPQREKAAFLTGVGSRSQVSLELSSMATPSTDTDRPHVDWSTKPTGTSAVSTSSTKEDSSPDSNLTLESDSSGVFLSLSNQSPEEASSDSDQPISGSDLDSSSTSLERDGDDGGLKEWGREESAELQWCYPSLLNTSLHEDIGGGKIEVAEHGKMGEDEETGKDENGGKAGKIGMVSIIQTPLDHTDTENSMTLNAPQNEEIPPRKKVTLMGNDSPLPLSPSKQPIKHLLDLNQKPIRSSGLDCGDLDPFVQSDSFVYLAVSARPVSRGEVTTATEVPTHGIKQDSVPQHLESKKIHLDQQSNTERDGKQTHLAPQKPEEGDFLCTDSFVYLAAPACLLLGPAGTTPYSGRESDSESSGSGPVDLSVLVCGSVAGDSDWDSDLSDSDPSRSSRISAADNKSTSMAQPKRVPAELGWDLFGETTESEVLSELFREQDRNNNGKTKEVTGVTTSMVVTQAIPMATQPVTTPMKLATTGEQSSATKKVTWQFKPAQRSVCTGSRKEKEKEVTSSSLVRFTELGGGETYRPSPSSSSSSSSSPSSSSSG
ncbi:uncharacterized protein LOC143331250 isoform X1 [Chaetodon auriga]|uniref:uncharacterized protein LOC143331250 isoform X1 n=2 Tax=Chaetodon auriga TaxID=39042 RepID=UPI0040330A0B